MHPVIIGSSGEGRKSELRNKPSKPTKKTFIFTSGFFEELPTDPKAVSLILELYDG